MKRIIDGKTYNTETAERVVECGSSGHVSRSDFAWHSTYLYRSPKGAFFLAGEGGPLSMWATCIPNGSTGGSGIRLVTEDEARAIAERERLNDGDYARIFGEPEEG